MTREPDLALIAVAPTADGRPVSRFLFGDEAGSEWLLEELSGTLTGPHPPGRSNLHGHWRAPTDEEGARARAALAAHERRPRADDGAPAGASAAQRSWRSPSPEPSDPGGAVWDRQAHPSSLDDAAPTSSRIISELRSERAGYPLSVLVHARSCEKKPPFAEALLASGRLRESDEVWLAPAISGEGPDGLGLDAQVLDRSSGAHRVIYERMLFDIVVLSGDEGRDSLPDDAFIGRASVVIIEAIGPKSPALLDYYLSTDVLLFLAYPTSGRLWQASARPPRTGDLVDCLVRIARTASSDEDRARCQHVISTLAVALQHDGPGAKEVLVEVERRLLSEGPGSLHWRKQFVSSLARALR